MHTALVVPSRRSGGRRGLTAVAVATLLLGVSVPAGAAPDVALVSSDGQGTSVGPVELSRPAVDGTGRYVLFSSAVAGIVPGDVDGVADVFRKDITTGRVQRVSVGGSGPARRAGISADGRYVVFYADRTYLRDVTLGSTTVMSRGLPQPMDNPAVSDDGSVVALCEASGPDGGTRVRVIDRARGKVVDVGNGCTFDLTGDGRRIVFQEREGAILRLVRLNLVSGRRQVLFEDDSGAGGSLGGPVLPFVNADASVVVFSLRTASDAVRAFVWQAGVVTSLTDAALSAPGPVSDDGNRVVLVTAASADALGKVVVLDRSDGVRRRMGTTEYGFSVSLSGDGRAVSWTTVEALVSGDSGSTTDAYMTRLPPVSQAAAP